MARNEAVGKARYETEVDLSGLAKGLKDGDAEIKASGSRAEAAATKNASSAVAKLANIGKAGMVALSGVATGITVALVGRLQALDRATADFRQETGATAEEAKRAGQAINDMAGRNLQPIEEIGATLSKVHTDLGLTGEAAEQTAEKFLRFAQASGQDAAGAVLAFDDILDAWGLTADDAAGIMDQLVASTQQYGGTVEDTQAALSDLAPAMRAMNLTVDDTIGLLDLFKASGIDASASMRGLNSAVTRLPKGENLITFLDRISGIEDPTKRASEAVKVFGSQAGVKLANALGPGKGALADYVIAAEDVPGATEKAADASLTLVDRLKIGFEGFISSAVGMLGAAGPLLTAVGALAPLLIPAFAGVWKAVIGSEVVTGAIAAAGAKAGAIFVGSAEGVGLLGGILGALKGVGLASLIAGALARVPLAVPLPDAKGYDDPKVQRAFLEKATLGELQGMLEFAKRTGDKIGQEVIQGYIDRLGGDRDLAIPETQNLWTTPIPGATKGGEQLGAATVEGFLSKWRELGTAAHDSGDYGALGEFLEANRAFIVEQWDKLGADAQKNLRAAGYGISQELEAQQDIWRRAMVPTPKDYGGPAQAVRRSFGNAFRTMDEMKQPWKDAWAELAEWAKDPFRPKKFAEWLKDKHDDALRRARKAAEDNKPKVAERWREIARAMTSPIIAALGEVTGDVDKLIEAIITMDRLNQRVGKGIARMGTTEKVAGRASGGPTEAGESYIVGEDGPELWSSRSAGNVTSTPALARLIGQAIGMASIQPSRLEGTATVNHQVSGRVEVALSGDTVAAAREQGASWDDIGRMAAAARSVLTETLRGAARSSSLLYSSPRRQ